MPVLNYATISGQKFQMTLQKLYNTPTNNKSAGKIGHIVKLVQDALNKMRQDFQSEIVEKFAKRDAEGKIVRPDGEPLGFDLDETKKDEFNKAQENFGKTEVTIDWNPLNPEDMVDMKLSASELTSLESLYSDTAVNEAAPLRSIR